MKIKMMLVLAATVATAPLHAAQVYFNDFDGENGGASAVNYNGFTGLAVTDGTVDLVKNGDFGITCAGNTGSCVDLDGSTNDAGLLMTTGAFAYNAFDLITLTFDFIGNQRGGSSDDGAFGFSFGGAASGLATFSSTSGALFTFQFDQNNAVIFYNVIESAFPLDHLTLSVRPTTGGTINAFFQDDGADNIGPIIDNLALSIGAVPEPASWAMMIGGFGAVGGALRSRRSKARVTFA